MGKFDNQLAHWREQHRVAVEDLGDLQAGKRKIAEDTGEGWVDITDRWMEKLRNEVVVPCTANRGVREAQRKKCEPQSSRAWGLGTACSNPLL